MCSKGVFETTLETYKKWWPRTSRVNTPLVSNRQDEFFREVTVGPTAYENSEDLPRTCKWLGSPLFTSHEKAIYKGNNPI